MEIEQHICGFTDKGEALVLYKMTNARGAFVELINAGAAIVSVCVPDRDGNLADVALGYRDCADYLADSVAMGKTVGRYANRIAKGRFTLDGKEYKLAANNGPNHLHGGVEGFSSKVWDGRVETNRVVFSLTSPDGDQRYPGTLGVEVVYDWDDEGTLEITYYARTDAPTVVNLSNHAYFNLAGKGTILSHQLQLNASRYLPVDATLIPTGELAPVAGTPMDFTSPKPIGKEINADNEQLRFGKGYDHCWAIDGWEPGKKATAAVLYDPASGRMLTVDTTQPGVQVYTGNYLSQAAGDPKSGREFADNDGVAVECQRFPDSPNKPQFPSAVLAPGQMYEEHIWYRFTVK